MGLCSSGSNQQKLRCPLGGNHGSDGTVTDQGGPEFFSVGVSDEHLPVRAQAAQLSLIAHLWLLVNTPTASQMAERVVVDRLLRALPQRLRHTVGMRGPTSLSALLEAVERAEASAACKVGERAGLPPGTWKPCH